MKWETYAAYDRVLPEELDSFRGDLGELSAFTGVVLLDPEDGLAPAYLAGIVKELLPRARLVLPLVARDRNRTALLGEARTARALGANGLLLLSGRLDPSRDAATVYELDPLQMLGFLDEQGIALERWVSSRCATAAEQARVASLARAGASRCLLPWSAGDEVQVCEALSPLLSVSEADWAAGRLPGGEANLVFHVVPGRGAAAAWAAGRGRA